MRRLALLLILLAGPAHAAQQTIPGGAWWLMQPGATSAGTPGGTTALLMDASGEKAEFVFIAPKTGDIDSFGVRLGAVTQAPGNGLTFSIQDISATTGLSDGTQDAKCSVTTGITANTWLQPSGFMGATACDSGAKKNITRGTFYVVVVEFTSFTAGDSLEIIVNNEGNAQISAAYVGHNGAKTTGLPLFALEYSDGSYATIDTQVIPYMVVNSVNLNTGVDPDEAGLRCQFPAPIKVGGFWARLAVAAGANFDMVLYDSGGSALATASHDGDYTPATTGRSRRGWFSSDITLSANTTYRFIIKPTTATNVTIYNFEVNDTLMLGGVPGGTTCYWTQRVDAGSFSDTNTKRPYLGVLITGVDDAVSAGGGGCIIGGALFGPTCGGWGPTIFLVLYLAGGLVLAKWATRRW